MNKNIAFRVLLLTVVMSLHSFGFSQVRKPAQSSAPVRNRPPFLQQAKLFEESKEPPYVTKLVLRNGLTILVEERRTQPVVSIQTYIRAGTFQEPPQSLGVCRLVASLIERGSSNNSIGTLSQNVRALGGIFTRSVDYESTRLEIIAPSSQWKQALDLQAGALLNFTFDTNDLVLEANRVRNEARDALEDSLEFAKEKLLELAFDQPRMGKFDEIAGAELSDIKRETLVDFYKAMYTFPKITLVISGDVSASEVLNEVVRVYGKPSVSAAKSIPVPVREPRSQFRYSLLRGDVPIPHVLFGFQAVPESAEDFRAFEVLGAILGLGEGSVFNRRLRDQMGLIWSEETGLLANPGFGYFLIQMKTDTENIDKCQIATLTEIELLKRKEPEKADLARAQAQLELEYWKRIETVSGRAEALAYYESLGDWKRMDRYISEIRKVEPSDIKRVANKYLRLDRCSLLEYLPTSEVSRSTTAEGIRQTLEELLAGSADEEQAKREKEIVPFMKIPEATGGFSPSEIQYPFQMASILRGPDMYIREDHTEPVIEMGLFFRGGKFAEKDENAGITRLLSYLMVKGTKDMPASQFHQQLEIYGGRLQPIVDDDCFGIMFSILSKNFAAGFDLLQQSIKTPVFDKDDINRQKERQKRLILERNNSEAFAKDLMNKALFKDFSYARNSLGSDSSLSGITWDSIIEWHDEYVKNRKPIVVIIGDTKGTGLAAQFVQHFSGSRMRDSTIPEEWTKPLEKSEETKQNWEKDWSVILIGFQAPPVDDEDGYAVTVLENLAGNSDRLPPETRGILEATHKVSINYEPRLRGGSLFAYAIVNPGDGEKTLGALKDEIKLVVTGPNTYRDVRSAISAAVGGYQIMNQARFEQIHHVVEYLLAGKGIDSFINFPTELRQVKDEDLSEAAQRILNMEKAVIVHVRGKSR